MSGRSSLPPADQPSVDDAVRQCPGPASEKKPPGPRGAPDGRRGLARASWSGAGPLRLRP
jgi:hypothetical protein